MEKTGRGFLGVQVGVPKTRGTWIRLAEQYVSLT